MKYHLLILLTIVAKSKCHVTERTKSDQNITRTSLKNNTLNLENVLVNNTDGGNSNSDVSNIYLDDVIFQLKNRVWTEEDQPCLDHIYGLLDALRNFTLWAVWNWDAQPFAPQGILFGNKYQLGNFDQCVNPPWAQTHPEHRTKYCLADVTFQRIEKTVKKGKPYNPYDPYGSALNYIEHQPPHTRPFNEMAWGVCVPESCGPRTVEKFLDVMLSRSHLNAAGMRANITINDRCQDYNRPHKLDGPFFGFVGLIGFLAFICLVCTYMNYRREKYTPDTLSSQIVKAFCLKENGQDLMSAHKDGIGVFYGIRFLTMCLIAIHHEIGIYNAGPISDGVILDKDAQSPLGLLVLHNDLFVDTFFLLSGFLAIVNLAKFKVLPNPALLIFRRYVRSVVALGVVVFFVGAMFPHLGSGPLWVRASHDATLCRENWWLNILMVNNYINTENICIIASWYIPCDFHFFVVTVLVYFLYKKYPRLGLAIAAILSVASIVLPGILNYIYQSPPVQAFTYEFVIDPRKNKDFHLTYMKSHMRYSTYLIGFFSGFFFVNYGTKRKFLRIKKKWSVLGICFILAIMLTVMLMGGSYLWRDYHPIEGAVYAALNRPVWAGGISLLVLFCAFYVPLVKWFLSWYEWVPLSRLSYGLYLMHTVIITRNIFSARNPTHNDYFVILSSAIGAIFWGCAAAVAIWMLAEAPANKLLAMCLKSQMKKGSETNISQDTSATASVSNMQIESNGHMHSNLPSTLSYSTKI